MSNALTNIIIKGAREHNLKDVSLDVPKNKLVVFTGVSGSGKSSMAMDTIYAEGQRRYVESLSAYARQFLGVLSKPDVDSIEGLSPAIAIDQKTTSKNPRSTVGTITEIYDFLRLLYARIGHPFCPECGREISRQSIGQIVESVVNLIEAHSDFKTARGVRFYIMAPVVQDRKGEFSALFQNLKKQGITRARIDGKVHALSERFDLIKTNKHSVEAILSRQIVTNKRLKSLDEKKGFEAELYQTVETSLRLSSGKLMISFINDAGFDFPDNPVEMIDHIFSENFACPVCNLSLPELEPRSFSFNSPHGACPTCEGLGTQLNVDTNLLMNPELSILQGGIFPWSNVGEKNTWMGVVLQAVAKEHKFSLTVPIKTYSQEIIELLLYGPRSKEQRYASTYVSKDGRVVNSKVRFEGVVPNIMRRYKETASDFIRNELEQYMVKDPCSSCNGARLNTQALSVVIDKKNVWELTEMPVDEFWAWFLELPPKLNEREQKIAAPILKEIGHRVQFLLDVGLTYLSLGRSSSQLSGGEAQRIRLASQIGSGLSGVLYVLDEPSIGLHQRDQARLIGTLKHLRDLGNTVIVVEHDLETMLESDHIVDFGPGAGELGGQVIAQGSPTQIIKSRSSITGPYLKGKKVAQSLSAPVVSTGSLKLLNARGRNLKNISVDFPLGQIVCVTGVSGSGKSTLVMDTLYPALRQHFGMKLEERPSESDGILGFENIDKVIAIDQSPIGRTPKSNPATYTKCFDSIRDLYAKTEESRIRGYAAGRFSFNVKGGRCEACAGEGTLKIEMQFMPDVYVKCEVCEGKRYNREALEVTYKGKNISEVLNTTVSEALEFFKNIPAINRRLQTLSEVGLGYIKLGQPAPTLSGGEAQRVKLSLELSKFTKGATFYILDEPTTGLHFKDLEKLIDVIKKLRSKGHTVVIIEHNLDVILSSDWIIDLGPEGGAKGGYLLFSGPTQAFVNEETYTAKALKEHLKRQKQ